MVQTKLNKHLKEWWYSSLYQLQWCSKVTHGVRLHLGAAPLGGSATTTTTTAPIAHHAPRLGGSMPKIKVSSRGHSLLLSVGSGRDGVIRCRAGGREGVIVSDTRGGRTGIDKRRNRLAWGVDGRSQILEGPMFYRGRSAPAEIRTERVVVA